MAVLERLRRRARRLKGETVALYLAARHPATPWYARAFVVAVIAYAVSPIDLIPDFIPVLGYLDELILLPLAIVVAARMVPAPVLAECRARADELTARGRRLGRIGAVVIVAVWVIVAVAVGVWVYRAFA
jgi:uncharacterized membrane protein YkvA (DUF1232 family)